MVSPVDGLKTGDVRPPADAGDQLPPTSIGTVITSVSVSCSWELSESEGGM